MSRPSKRTAAEAELETPEVRGVRADMTVGRVFEIYPETWTSLYSETVLDVADYNVLAMHSHTILATTKRDGVFTRITLGDPLAKPRELSGLRVDFVYQEIFERLQHAVVARCSANVEWIWAAVVPVEKGYKIYFYDMQPQEDGSTAEIASTFEIQHDGIVTDLAVGNTMITLVLDHNDVLFIPLGSTAIAFEVESGTSLPVHVSCVSGSVSVVTENELRIWQMTESHQYTSLRAETCALSDVEDMIEKLDSMGLVAEEGEVVPAMPVDKPAMRLLTKVVPREELPLGVLEPGQHSAGHYSNYKHDSMAVTFGNTAVIFGPNDYNSPSPSPLFVNTKDDIIACLSLPGTTAFASSKGSFHVCTGAGGLLELELAPPKDGLWSQALISYVDPSCFLCYFKGAEGIHVVQHTDYAK